MRSICLFASYFTTEDIPYYITIYLKELKRHFSDVVFLCSQEELSVSSRDFLKHENIQYFIEKNEGFDFGLWYKFFQKTNVEHYDKLALVNDSCVLFKPLDEFVSWAMKENSDVQGMTYSEAIAPHVQSYFLLLNKRAISELKDYFKSHGIITHITDVIRTYEVGFSQYLISKDFRLSAYMGKTGSVGEFSPYYTHVKEHLMQGIPLIKKKILFASYRKDEFLTLARMNFDIDAYKYIDLIKQNNKQLIISFETLMSQDSHQISALSRFQYFITRSLIQLYRKIKYGR